MTEEQKDPTAGDPIDDAEDEEEEEEEEVVQDPLPEDPGPGNPKASAVPENPPEVAAPPTAIEPEQKSAVPAMSEIRPASFAESLASAAPAAAESENAATPDVKLEDVSGSAEDLPEPPQPDSAAQPEAPVEDETPPPQDKTIEVVNLDGDKIEFLESQAESPTGVGNDQVSIPKSAPGDIENGQPSQPTDEAENGQSELPPDEVGNGQSELSPDGAEDKPEASSDEMEGGESELPTNEVENNQSERPVDDAEGGQSEPPTGDAEGGQSESPFDGGEEEQIEAEVPLPEVNEEGISGEARSIENGDADVGTTEGALEGSETSSGAAETDPTGEPPLDSVDAEAIPVANIEAVSEVLGTPKEIGSIKGSNSDIASQDDEAVGRGDGMNEEELNDESKTDEQESSYQTNQIQELPNDEQNQAIPNQVEMPPKVSQAPAPPPAAPTTASCEPREPVSDVQSYLDPILGYDRYPCNLCNSSEDDEDPFAASIQFAYELFGHLVELVMSKLSQNNNPNEQ